VKTLELPPPADLLIKTEEHAEGEDIIRIEFYKAPDCAYFVWPYIRGLQSDGDAVKHFQVMGHFPSMDAARQAAINEGRVLISAGFDVNQIE